MSKNNSGIGLLWDLTKLFISVTFDFWDFTFGRIPVLGTINDIVGMFVGMALWGFPGLLQGWEIIDITDQVDGFVPTLTIVGIYSIIKKYS